MEYSWESGHVPCQHFNFQYPFSDRWQEEESIKYCDIEWKEGPLFL